MFNLLNFFIMPRKSMRKKPRSSKGEYLVIHRNGIRF